MKSDVIIIDNKGNGFQKAIDQTRKSATFVGLDQNESLDLQLLAEEMLSLVRSVTGKAFDLHVSTETVMDKEKRRQLIESSTSRKNEASTGFLGKLRNAFEEALTAEADRQDVDLYTDELSDLPGGVLGQADWDGYERSILQTVADQVKIGIKGGKVDVTICKCFG